MPVIKSVIRIGFDPGPGAAMKLSFAPPTARAAEAAILAVVAAQALAHHALAIWGAWSAGDVLALGDAWIMAEQSAFHVPLVLAAVAAATGRVGGRALLAAIAAGHWANEFRLLDGHLHGFLESNRLYPAAFYHGSGSVNVQYAILLLYAVALPWLASAAIRRRTLDRLFVLLIVTTTLGTTMLFHKVVVESALQGSVEHVRAQKLAAMRATQGLGADVFRSACRTLDVACLDLPEGAGMPLGGHWSPALAEVVTKLHRDTAGRPVRHAQALRIGVLKPDLRGEQYAYERDAAGARVMVDDASYATLPARYKAYFSILLVSAHAWWAGGGVALLAWHRRRLSRRGPARQGGGQR